MSYANSIGKEVIPFGVVRRKEVNHNGVALDMRGIRKVFGRVVANDSVNFAVKEGEIHALLGENGAGKTTLMSILYGLYEPEEGTILHYGTPVRIASPFDAIRLGIGMVHQHFELAEPLSVWENVVLGNEPTIGGSGFLDTRKSRDTVKEIAVQSGFSVEPDAVVETLPVGVRQRVEICKVLYRGAKILIFDEPTAVLTPLESRELFRTMKSLKERGCSIVFITHKLKEVMSVSDRVTVLRKGKTVGTVETSATDTGELARMMLGRDASRVTNKCRACLANPVVLTVSQLEGQADTGGKGLAGISFQIRAGEVLGIAGVEGNGQTELVETIVGVRRASGGDIILDGTSIANLPTSWILHQGVGLIPEDRQNQGLIMHFDIKDNLVLGQHREPPFCTGGRLRCDEIMDFSLQVLKDFTIRPGEPNLPVKTLSGGNQQKVLVGRELSLPELRLLVASQPTRGLDVGATEFIHRKLLELRQMGVAILLVSADLDEIMALSDRIAVMYEGRILATKGVDDVTEEELGELMGGMQIETHVT